MKSEDLKIDYLILRLVQAFIVLIMIMVFFGLGQFRPIPYIDKIWADNNPGKPVLLLSLDKTDYKIGEPIIYREVVLNDGDSSIFFPVDLYHYKMDNGIGFHTSVILTDENGNKLPFEGLEGNINILPLSKFIVKVKPHESVPCFGCSYDLLGFVPSWDDKVLPVCYKTALKNPGYYYLQTVLISNEVDKYTRYIQENGFAYKSGPIPVPWKGVLLSNRVKFEIKP